MEYQRISLLLIPSFSYTLCPTRWWGRQQAFEAESKAEELVHKKLQEGPPERKRHLLPPANKFKSSKIKRGNCSGPSHGLGSVSKAGSIFQSHLEQDYQFLTWVFNAWNDWILIFWGCSTWRSQLSVTQTQWHTMSRLRKIDSLLHFKFIPDEVKHQSSSF